MQASSLSSDKLRACAEENLHHSIKLQTWMIIVLLIGSSAGIITAGLGEKFRHHLTFGRWFRIGFPFMIIA